LYHILFKKEKIESIKSMSTAGIMSAVPSSMPAGAHGAKKPTDVEQRYILWKNTEGYD
jgi:hypothetical protein